jgi:hypothetical protein
MLTMQKQRRLARALGTAFLAAMLTMLALTGSASAKLTGEFTNFQFCPYKNLEVNRCAAGVTEGGEVVLGSKTVPIVNPVKLQGGFSKPVEGFSKFFAATNGVTLEKVPQPVPGGLLGLVPPEGSPPLVKALVEFATENGLTGVNSTLELARPASEIEISESNLGEGEGVALRLPVKFRLENPLLGTNCYVGSSTSPVIWNLTSGITAPPGPNEPIEGFPGEVEFLESFILKLTNNVLVDNAWSAPKASGCGGPLLSLLIDPVINTASGLPSAAGNNTAILENTLLSAATSRIRINDEENP